MVDTVNFVRFAKFFENVQGGDQTYSLIRAPIQFASLQCLSDLNFVTSHKVALFPVGKNFNFLEDVPQMNIVLFKLVYTASESSRHFIQTGKNIA